MIVLLLLCLPWVAPNAPNTLIYVKGNFCANGTRRRRSAYPFKRGYLVRLRHSKLTTKDDGEPWYPSDQRERN
jgi:hypothetical protein